MGIGLEGVKGLMGPRGPSGLPGLPGLGEQARKRPGESTGATGPKGMKGDQVCRGGVALVARLASTHGSFLFVCLSCRCTHGRFLSLSRCKACRFFPFLLIGAVGIAREERREGQHGHRTGGSEG